MNEQSVPAGTAPGHPERPAVSLSGLSVTFTQSDGTEHEVLRDLDLDVPRGQFIALVGKSGGGKTTILNVLTGLVTPTSGRAAVLGVRPTDARSRIGFVPARDALLPWRTAVRNVEYSLELRGVDRADRKRIAHRYLALVSRTPPIVGPGSCRRGCASALRWSARGPSSPSCSSWTSRLRRWMQTRARASERDSGLCCRVARRVPSYSSLTISTRLCSWPTA